MDTSLRDAIDARIFPGAVVTHSTFQTVAKTVARNLELTKASTENGGISVGWFMEHFILDVDVD